MIRFQDRVTINDGMVRRTSDGYLVADAHVARTGIQRYLGSEVGKPDTPVVRVYRPPESVFAKDAMTSYAFRPMTNNHPEGSELVTSDNWKDLSIGQTGGEVARDGDMVRVPLVLMDSKAIEDYDRGKRELSMGYEADLEFVDGVTPDGEEYDAVQKNMRMNHLALVDRARGGDRLRIGDWHTPLQDEEVPTNPKQGGLTMADNLRKVVLDGLTIETTEQGEQAITKLQSLIADSTSVLDAAKAESEKAIALKDAEIAKKDAEIEELKSKIVSDADLDKLVASRSELVGIAKQLTKDAEADFSGMSDLEIKTETVKSQFGDAAVADKSAAYIDARFDVLVEQAQSAGSSDPVRAALGDSKVVTADSSKAYEDHVTELQNAWKTA